MTTVKYFPDQFRMEIKGHADFAPAGEDIVCAGVSTLTYALISAVDEKPELLSHFYFNNLEAEIRVQCNPSEDMEDTCKTIFDTVFHGYQNLEESYPDHVKTIGG